MNTKRHQVLGKELATSVEECLAVLKLNDQEDRAGIATSQPRQHEARQSLIGTSLKYAVMEHLGYGPIALLRQRLDEGMDAALEYFFGDWWRVEEKDAPALDKSRSDRSWLWFDVLPNALLIGGLLGRWDDVSKICSWFSASVAMEYELGKLDDQVFLCIASNLRPEPIPGIESVLADVKSCRTKRVRLLCAAWEAAVAKDQKAFDKALRESVRHFLKVEARDVPNTMFWVALHPSFVWLIAERNGLQFPTLPDDLDAAVIRRQTTGLD